MKHSSTLFLFDVDGTLTLPRQRIDSHMLDFLRALRNYVSIGFIGGSNLEKQKEQITEQILELFDYSMPENGLIFYTGQQKMSEKTMISYLGEDKLQSIINDSLKYLAEIHLPFKRGNFIELRTGLLNVSPPGRTCTLQERKHFYEYDKLHSIRVGYCNHMRICHPDIAFSIGGQISIDVFPNGWDKTYCLRHLVPRALEDHLRKNKNCAVKNKASNTNGDSARTNMVNGISTDSNKASNTNGDSSRTKKDIGVSTDPNTVPGIKNIEEKCTAGNLSVNTEPGTVSSSENKSAVDLVDEIYFFGDMILEGQNDYELMVHPLVNGIGTTGPQQTRKECLRILWEKGWVEQDMGI